MQGNSIQAKPRRCRRCREIKPADAFPTWNYLAQKRPCQTCKGCQQQIEDKRKRKREATSKRCKICKLNLPASDFHATRQVGRNGEMVYLHSYCKKCQKNARSKWHFTEAGQMAATKHRLKIFGLSPEQYAELVASQGGVCAICRQKERRNSRAGKVRRLSVDHCHKTGKVRGALCMSCNNGIGYFNDDRKLLKSAIEYLSRHEET